MKTFNLNNFISSLENLKNGEKSGYKEATFSTKIWEKNDKKRLYIKMNWRKREIDMGYIDLKDENFGYYVNQTGELDTISNRINDIRKENIETVDETVTASEITYEVKTDERNRKYIETENCKLIVSERFIKIYDKDGAGAVEKDKDILTTYIENNKDNEENKELVNCLTYIRDTNFLETI